jgi:hypothetical protein
MQAHVLTPARTSTAPKHVQTYVLIAAMLLLGLVASIAVDPYRGDPALVDGSGLFLSP